MSVTHEPMVRHGRVRWLCEPPHGVARLHVERRGETTPGELLAVAYSAFMAADLAARLERNGVPATELVVQAWCRLSADSLPRSVEELDVQVRGRVAGIGDEQFRAIAQVALGSSHKSLRMRHDVPRQLSVSLAG